MAHAVTSYPSASVYKAENLDAMSRGVAEQHAAWSNRHLEGRGVVCAITPCLGDSITNQGFDSVNSRYCSKFIADKQAAQACRPLHHTACTFSCFKSTINIVYRQITCSLEHQKHEVVCSAWCVCQSPSGVQCFPDSPCVSFCSLNVRKLYEEILLSSSMHGIACCCTGYARHGTCIACRTCTACRCFGALSNCIIATCCVMANALPQHGKPLRGG